MISTSLDEVRAEVLSRPGLVGARLGRVLSEAYDTWLREHLPAEADIALVAVGGLGRREQAPYSDLDLVLVHRRPAPTVQAIADTVWYPIWDSGVRLDHSVRTVEQAVAVARTDLKVMLGLLDVRHVAGDAALSGDLRERALALWRRTATARAPELAATGRARWAAAGEAAFLLEPDLKDSRGGLRDWHALRALAAAQLLDVPAVAAEAGEFLLDARVELHRVTGRAEDVLRAQEQAAVAAALDLADDDAVLRAVNEAGRTLAHVTNEAWRRVLDPPRPARRFGRRGPDRRPLAQDVVAQNGEVVLALAADPWADPVLVLRAARMAAEHDLPLSPFAVDRLVSESAPLPEPWPASARDELVALLATGARAISVLEALDQAGLLTRLVPEWEVVRFKAQHNPVHRYTVDRHLLECAARAAERTREVARPDLLLVGALLHDIGKGYPGDHSVVGAPVAGAIATRFGFEPADVERVVALVRHHLLLPHTATRRDPGDMVTLSIVAERVGGSHELLDQLHALTIADAAATGPAAWSPWKGSLVRELVERVHAMMAGEPVASDDRLDAARLVLAEAGQLAVEVHAERIVLAAADRPGLLSDESGVLALHSLDVRSADIATHAGMAVNAFVVSPRFGSQPDAARLHADLAKVLGGSLPLGERLRAKERAYRPDDAQPPAAPPRVLWFDHEATDATIVELRAADSFGLLHRVTAALEACAVDIRSARVSTLGGSVVDAFYVTGSTGGPVEDGVRHRATDALLAAAGGAAVSLDDAAP
ncbi:MAG: [protein-PII] uridylyltransferase [bacterium]